MQVIDWQVIVKKYGFIVWQIAYRLLDNEADAADCFQETFICALEVSRRQRVRKFPALLARLATNRAIDKLRQRISQSKTGANAVDLAALPNKNFSPAEQVQSRELAERLRKALTKLPMQEAEVFCLRYLSEMSYRQIAKELKITINLVGVLLHRAKAKLAESLNYLRCGE